MEAPRGGGGGKGGGYKESGLHVLYLLANSLLCLKSSGDRTSGVSSKRDLPSTSATAGTPSATQVIDLEETASEVAPLTLLDERNPQQIHINSPFDAFAGSSSGRGWSQGSNSGGRETSFSLDELAAIRSLALSDNAFPLLVHSLCPTIFGHELVKAGLLLGLFGGSSYRSRAQVDLTTKQTESEGGSGSTAGGGNAKDFQVRADIHVLVVGDPGLGKVQYFFHQPFTAIGKTLQS